MPIPIVSARNRVVWTREEKMRMDRCAKDVNAHGDKLLLRCGSALCPDQAIALTQNVRGETLLRCGCTDRVFVKVF